MDYRFIHSIVQEVYVDLEMSNAGQKAPAAHLKELRRYTGAFDVQELGLEDSYSLLPLRAQGEIPVVYMSHTGRKHNTASEGIFIQAEGWIQSRESMLENFDKILATPFYTEAEIDAFAARGSVPGQEGGALRHLPEVAVDPAAIRAILYGVTLRWLQGTPQVHIAVPKAEMGRYNDYVLGAVRQIWSYFPAYMRANVGFASFLSPRRERDFPRFSVIFLPFSMADANTVRLDGSSPNAYNALVRSTGMPELDTVLDELASHADPAERRSFLEDIFEDVEQGFDLKGRNFSAMSYMKWGRGLQLLKKQGDAAQLLPEWLAFNAQMERNKDSYPAAVARKIQADIDQRLQPDGLREALRQELKGGRPTVQLLEGAVNKYWPLCQSRPALKEVLWSFVRNGLENTGLGAEKIYRALNEHEQSWSRLTDPDSFGSAKRAWGEQTARELEAAQSKQLQETAQAALRLDRVSAKKLKQDLEALREMFRRSAAPYADAVTVGQLDAALEQEQRGYVLAALQKELEQDRQTPPRGHRAIQAAQQKTQEMADLLPADKSEEELELLGQFQARQAELLALLQDSRTVSADLQEKVRGIPDYFPALEAAAAQAAGLSDADRDALRQILLPKRPQTAAEYQNAFRAYSGRAISLPALNGRPAFFRNCVTEDQLALQSGPQTLDGRDLRAAGIVSQIGALRKDRELSGAEGPLQVYLDGSPVDAELVERVASLDARRAEGLDGESLKDMAQRLIRVGAFTPEQLPSLLELYEAAHAKLGALVKTVLSGEAGEMDTAQQRRFLEKLLEILQRSYDKQRVEALGWISEKLDQCQATPEAEAAFRSLAGGGKKKPKTWLIVLLSVLGALLVAGVVLALVLILGKKPEPVDPTDPVQTAMDSAYADQQAQLSGSLSLRDSALQDADLSKLLGYYQAKDAFGADAIPADVLEDEELLGLLGYRTRLDLGGQPALTDLSALGELQGLRRLYLDGDTALSSLNGVAQLERLELLDLRDTQISEQEIGDFTALHPDCLVLFGGQGAERIALGQTRYAAGEPLLDLSGQGAALLRAMDEPAVAAAVSAVQELHLGGAALEDLSALQQLTELHYLDLRDASLKDAALQGLYNMTGLRLIDLQENTLSRSAVEAFAATLTDYKILAPYYAPEETEPTQIFLAGEAYPADLSQLDLSGKTLSEEDLQQLAAFPSLSRLSLRGCGLTDLSALSGLRGLTRLDIRDNALTDLSALTGLDRLELLLADGNALTSLGLEEDRTLPALRMLSIGGVSEELDLTALRFLPMLTVLDLGDVREREDAPLTETLQGLTELRILRLQSLDQLLEQTREALPHCALIATAPSAAPAVAAPAEPAADGSAETDPAAENAADPTGTEGEPAGNEETAENGAEGGQIQPADGEQP